MKFRNRLTSWFLAIAATLVLTPMATAQLTWNITYADDGTGAGFAIETVDGANRQATVASALAYLSSQFDARGTIQFTMNASTDLGGSTLASAGSTFIGGAAANGIFQNGMVFRRGTTNTAPNFGTPTPDGSGQFDFTNFTWNNTTDPVQSGQFDLYSVALHEFTHAIGFVSRIRSNGAGGGNLTVGTADRYGQIARFYRLGSAATDPLLITSGGAFNTTEIADPTAAVASENVYFHGAFAKAANGGNAVQIYAPNPFESGSSLSHLDNSFDPAVMTPSFAAGDQIRTYRNVEIAMMIDLGWNQFFWSGSSGNWGDNTSDITSSPWQNFEQVNGTYASNVTTTLSPVGTITPNMVLTFNGSSTFTSTNNLTLAATAATGNVADRFLVNRMILDNSSTSGTSTIAANGSQVLRFDTSIGITPRIEQNNTGAFTISHAIELTANNLELGGTGTGTVTITGPISETSGAGATIIKTGTAEFILSGANTITGDISVTEGTLRANNSSGSATGTGTVTVSGDGNLAGSGTITGDVVIDSGGTVAPGNSTGTLTVGNTTFAGGGFYDFEINNATGVAGTASGWDLLQGTAGATLDISADSGNPFTINLISLTAGQTPGLAQNFASNTPFTWELANFDGGITNFSAGAFTVNTSAFQNNFGGGSFSVVMIGDTLNLQFTPVPEPGLMLAFGAMFAGGVGYVRRRRSASVTVAA